MGISSQPSARKLYIYSIDPALAQRVEAFDISECVIEIPWEDLEPGPVGTYLEVVDYDPQRRVFYTPIDLNAPYVMADYGIYPTESDPRFHQQMVYAVAMYTIKTFEAHLGRKILWAPHPYSPKLREPIRKFWAKYYDEEASTLWSIGMPVKTDSEKSTKSSRPLHPRYIDKLRIYPHGFVGENAYYSPNSKSLIFGYFDSHVGYLKGVGRMSGKVFSCLSFDIITHEITHAILDGIQPGFLQDTNPDVPAFHEAFSDLIALFQHFSIPLLLRHQVSVTRGNMNAESILYKIAEQFAQGSSGESALRDALGSTDSEGVWKRKTPEDLVKMTGLGPHARGAILVSAVFDAYVAIYGRRTSDLMRLASGGTGELRAGAIPIELRDRLADEAAKTARHFVGICIRAIDYLPPVDVIFTDYLRALITADLEMVPNDWIGYRVAIIESFRKWGIIPEEIQSLGEEAVAWDQVEQVLEHLESDPRYLEYRAAVAEFRNWMGDLASYLRTQLSSKRLYGSKKPRDPSDPSFRHDLYVWSEETQREIYFRLQDLAGFTLQGERFVRSAEVKQEHVNFVVRRVLGLDPTGIPPRTLRRGDREREEKKEGRIVGLDFEKTTYIHSVRPCIKQPTSGHGRPEVDIIIVIWQKERRRGTQSKKLPEAGSTLILSLEEERLKYSICKRLGSNWRLEQQEKHAANSDPYRLAVDQRLSFAALHGVTK